MRERKLKLAVSLGTGTDQMSSWQKQGKNTYHSQSIQEKEEQGSQIKR